MATPVLSTRHLSDNRRSILALRRATGAEREHHSFQSFGNDTRKLRKFNPLLFINIYKNSARNLGISLDPSFDGRRSSPGLSSPHSWRRVYDIRLLLGRESFLSH